MGQKVTVRPNGMISRQLTGGIHATHRNSFAVLQKFTLSDATFAVATLALAVTAHGFYPERQALAV
jgi:hypothetical protein